MTTDSTRPGRPADDADRHEAGAGTPSTGADTPPQDPLETPAAAAGRDPPPPPAAPRRGAGRLMGTLALLLALAALGGAGYLYYELIHRGEVRAVADQVDDLESRLDEVGRRFDRLAGERQTALEELRRQQEAARTETARSLRESLADVARQAPPSTGEWQRAEAQYLLRIANHRLLMERDVEGALRLLEAADSVLEGLDDFALHEVRARLADEIAALENVEGTDVQGLFLRLESVKRNLDELPLRVPEYLAREPEPEPQADDGDVWSVLSRQLSGMLDYRRLDGAVKPLLAPEEAVYLELNLRLMLERAQLAAVRRDQLIYEQSIATAVDWINSYLDTGKRPVQRMLDELDALAGVELRQPLPDISGSLNALKEVLRNPA